MIWRRWRKSSRRGSINGSGLGSIYLIIAVITAMIGYQIHGSIGWSIVDFFCWPIAWIKWLICQECTLSVIKAAFSWFSN